MASTFFTFPTFNRRSRLERCFRTLQSIPFLFTPFDTLWQFFALRRNQAFSIVSALRHTKVGEPLGFLVSFFASLLPHFLASSMAFSRPVVLDAPSGWDYSSTRSSRAFICAFPSYTRRFGSCGSFYLSFPAFSGLLRQPYARTAQVKEPFSGETKQKSR